MNQRTRASVAGLAIVGLFLAVQVGALALVQPFLSAGYQTVENPTDPTNSLIYIGALLVFTVLMLAVLRMGQRWLLRWFIIFTSGLISWYVFTVVVPPVLTVPLAGSSVNVLALVAAGAVALALLVYPEWYVIDGAGIIMGAGAAGLFGISFGVLPAIVMLVVLAIYDAISVYGTKHMLTLASGVMDMKIPVILVVPLSLSYSFRELESQEGRFDGDAAEVDGDGGDEKAGDEEAVDEEGGDGEGVVGDGVSEDDPDADGDADQSEGVFERDAFFIGLGDAVMPTVMVASAATFSTAPPITLLGLTLNLPALFAVAGTLVGLVVLLRLVMAGRPHAGLPLLNGGAIGGYLLGAILAGIPLVEALGLSAYL